ncbi:MAG: ABC transporter substrate binding protein [Deferrisomatales bacterium]|nr:ABC transporter substrate binding protein [Deferrisomatales bacterium]
MNPRPSSPDLAEVRSRSARWRAAGPLWLLALALGLLPGSAAAEHIVTLRSAPLAVYDTALQGFQAGYGAHLRGRAQKTVAPIRYTDLLLTELDEGAAAAVRAARPDLLVTVGQHALDSVAELGGVPMVHLLASRVPPSLAGRDDVRGVSVAVSPEQWVEAFTQAMPGRRRVGVVHDPRRTGPWVERATAFGRLHQITVIGAVVAGARGVADALDQLRGGVDALWMIPDLTAVTPDTVPLLAEFSLEEGIPVFSFAEKYLEVGATAAFVLDPETVGRQGAALGEGLVRHAPGEGEPQFAARAVMRVNRALAFRFLPAVPYH